MTAASSARDSTPFRSLDKPIPNAPQRFGKTELGSGVMEVVAAFWSSDSRPAHLSNNRGTLTARDGIVSSCLVKDNEILEASRCPTNPRQTSAFRMGRKRQVSRPARHFIGPQRQLFQLAHDSAHAPPDVLPRTPQDQITHRLGQPRSADLPRFTAATLLALPSAIGLDADNLQGILDRMSNLRSMGQACRPPQRGHTRPSGHRKANRYARQSSSVENPSSNFKSVRV